MKLRPDLAWLVSGLTADASKILFDQPGAAYDQAYSALEHAAPLPIGLRGRAMLVGAVLLAKHLLGGQSAATGLAHTATAKGPVGHFISEVADDAVTETLKRIIEHAGTAPIDIRPVTPIADEGPVRVPLARRINSLTRTIAPWMGQKEV